MSTHRLTFHLYPGVIPAKAGIHLDRLNSNMDSRFRGNDEQKSNKATATP
jgi:hypothetical protein